MNVSNNDFSVLFFIVNRSLEIAENDGGYYGKLFDYHQTLLCFFDGGFVDCYSDHKYKERKNRSRNSSDRPRCAVKEYRRKLRDHRNDNENKQSDIHHKSDDKGNGVYTAQLALYFRFTVPAEDRTFGIAHEHTVDKNQVAKDTDERAVQEYPAAGDRNDTGHHANDTENQDV